jgi:hypothetical protein
MIAALLFEENRWVNAQRIEVSGGLSMANYRIGRKRRGVTWSNSNNVIEGNGRLVFKGDSEFAMDRNPGCANDSNRDKMLCTNARPTSTSIGDVDLGPSWVVPRRRPGRNPVLRN